MQRQSQNQLPDLALANIEALSHTEIAKGQWIITFYTPTHWFCANGRGVYCPDFDC